MWYIKYIMTSLNNKTVFITGGGSGIGLATSRKFVREGANVVIFTRTVQPEIEIPAEKSLVIKGDVTSRKQVKEAMGEGMKKFGSLDILINNAGVARRENFLETDEKDWDFVIDVNMKGVFICMQEFIALCKKSTDGCQGKMIINIASGAGIYGVDEIAVYSSTKAAVINITQGLNEELKNLEMKFIAVCPGATNTKMFKDLFPEEKPYHTPEQVAEVIYKTAVGEIKPDERLIVDVFHHIH